MQWRTGSAWERWVPVVVCLVFLLGGCGLFEDVSPPRERAADAPREEGTRDTGVDATDASDVPAVDAADARRDDSGLDTDAEGPSDVDDVVVDADTADADTDDADDVEVGQDTEDVGGDTEDVGPVDTDGGDAADTSSPIAFRVTSPRSDRPVRYELRVTVQPTKVRDGSRFEAEQDNDEITQNNNGGWTITGQTGTAPSADKVHGDSYRWPRVQDPTYGITGWGADAPAADYTITIDGTEVDPGSLPELPERLIQDGCVGGGTCYKDSVTASEADATVGASASLSDLKSALQNASSGDVVFVDPQAEIDLGFSASSPSVEVPAGVTLASNRGTNGSEGARLYGQEKSGTDWKGSDTISLNDDVRLTGLRIEGPAPNRQMEWGSADDYTDGIDLERASNVEIDNNEIYGWPAAAVRGGDPVHVHHNQVHDNDQYGLGYGIAGTQWDSTIEYNQFRHNRRGISGAGESGDGYIARFNVFGSSGVAGAGQKINMNGKNGEAGARMEVHHNTVKFADAQGVYIRGTPRQTTEVYKNWFHNATLPCLTKNQTGHYCAIQVKADDWTNVDYYDNSFGTSEPSCDVGAPRSGC